MQNRNPFDPSRPAGLSPRKPPQAPPEAHPVQPDGETPHAGDPDGGQAMPAPLPPISLLSLAEVADIFRRSTRTIRRWIAEGGQDTKVLPASGSCERM